MLFNPGRQAQTPQQRRWRLVAMLVIYLVAATLHLDFVLNHPLVPIDYADQGGYWRYANYYSEGLRSFLPGLLGPPEEQSEEYITEVRNWLWTGIIAFPGERIGVWPLLLTPLHFFSDPEQAVYVVQALFFATLPLAVILLLRGLNRPQLGWLAGLFSALYPNLIIPTGRLLQQGPAALALTWGLVGLVYLYRRQARPWQLYTSYSLLTLTGYITLVARPVLLLITCFYPVGPVRQIRRAKQRFLLTLAAIIFTWSALMALFTDLNPVGLVLRNGLGISVGTLQGAIEELNFGSFLHTELWRTDITFEPDYGLPPRRELLDLLLHDTVNAVGGLMTNAYRMLIEPYNPFGQTYLLNYDGQRVIYQALLGLSLLGLFVGLARHEPNLNRFTWVVLLLLGALLLIYAIIHIESRYRSVLTPAQIALAAIGASWLWNNLRWRVWLPLLGLWLINLIVSVPTLLSMLPALPAPTAHTLDVLLMGLSWVAAALLIVRAMPRTGVAGRARSSTWQGRAALLAASALALVFILGMSWDPTWRAWEAPLALGESVQQRANLGNANPPEGSVPVLLVDTAAPREASELLVTIDGQELGPLQPWYTTEPDLINNEVYPIYFAVSSDYFGAGFRRWWFAPLLPDLLDGQQEITVTVQNTGNAAIGLTGDYADAPDRYLGPSFSPWDDSRSLFRLWWGKEDLRVTIENDLQGITYSARRALEDGSWSDDLSAALGRQSGRYRVYVLWVAPEDMPAYNPP